MGIGARILRLIQIKLWSYRSHRASTAAPARRRFEPAYAPRDLLPFWNSLLIGIGAVLGLALVAGLFLWIAVDVF